MTTENTNPPAGDAPPPGDAPPATAAAENPHGLPDATVDATPIRTLAMGSLVVGLLAYIICGVAGAEKTQDWFLTYLVGFVFWASIPFGALGLSMIGFLTTASWGIVFRRTWQAALRTLPVVAALFVPVLVSVYLDGGKSSPFWWANHAWEGDPVEISAREHLTLDAVVENQHKIHDYLNPNFFAIRAVVYFAALGTLAFFLLKWSKDAESRDDENAKTKIYNASGPGMLLWAGMLTFATTDWVMSVEPTWASSMFPVVFGMNMFITAMSLGVLTFYSLTVDKPEVLKVVKEKFRIDIGTLLYGVTMVWAYASFCQYMLVWAGNLPEEATYYLKRGNDGWEYLAYFLMLFHWLVPFVVFLFRPVKTNPKRIRIMATLLMIVCAADVIWWILPAIPHEHSTLHVPMAIGAVLAVGGVWGMWFSREVAKAPILPMNSETKFLADWGHHH